jgi:hypothetical protein
VRKLLNGSAAGEADDANITSKKNKKRQPHTASSAPFRFIGSPARKRKFELSDARLIVALPRLIARNFR